MYKVKPEDVIPTRKYEDVESAKAAFKQTRYSNDTVLSDSWDSMAAAFSVGDVNKIASNAYRFIDELLLPLAEFSVCSSGCSHCCKLGVTVTKLEAAYIEKNTQHSINRVNKNGRKKRNVSGVGYCPFHNAEKAQCSIYDFRPISCRQFFTFDDPSNCVNPNTRHAISAKNGRTAIDPVNEIIDNFSSASRKDAGDIRDFFGHVKI